MLLTEDNNNYQAVSNTVSRKNTNAKLKLDGDSL